MNSYEWNYMVLELVDYIEENSSQGEAANDSWKYFKMFCSLKGLNWRVTRKMIEYTIGQPFNSETDLAENEAFRRLESGNEAVDEIPSPAVESKQKEFSIDFDF